MALPRHSRSPAPPTQLAGFPLPRWTGRYRSGKPNPLRRITVVASSATLVLATLMVPAFTKAPVVSQPAAAAAAASVQVLVFHGPAAQQDDPVVQATARIKALGA